MSNVDCGSGKWQQGVSGDVFGNVTKTGSGYFTPGFDPATNHVWGKSYDGNGNMTSDGANSYYWDAEGNLYQFLAFQGSTVTMVYDALGRRVEQTGAEMLYGVDGSKLAVMSGQTVTRAFVALPGGATAVYNASGLAWYRHADWLGSARLASTPSRTLYSDSAYAAYGEDIGNPAGAADRNFTGQNQDLAAGLLLDFPAREYRPGSSRWISPDPAGTAAANPANPQSWNRYGYVNGSPLNSVDPMGLTPKCMEHNACAEAILYLRANYGGGIYNSLTSTAYMLGTPTLTLWTPGSTTSVPTGQASITFAGVTDTWDYPGSELFTPGQLQILVSLSAVDRSFRTAPVHVGHDPWDDQFDVWANGFKTWIAGTASNNPNDNRPSCFTVFMDEASPSPNVGTYASVAAESTGAYYSATKFNEALQYAASKGLTSPSKSSIFRGILADSASAAATGALGGADASLAWGFGVEMKVYFWDHGCKP